MASAAVDEKLWTVARPEEVKPNADTKSKVTSKALSRLPEDQKSSYQADVKSQTSKKSIVASSVRRRQEYMSIQYPQRHQTDYPDYGDYSADPTQFMQPEKPPSASLNYTLELIENDPKTFEPLVDIAKLLSDNGVELRALTALKSVAADDLSVDRISHEVKTILA